MSSSEKEDIIIEGVREDGSRFRPSDWSERLSASLASFGRDHRLRYAADVHPCIIEGKKCLVVGGDLRRKDPDAYRFILEFARANDLRIQHDRRGHELPVPQERRHTPA
jgi:hypothetical protein